MASDTTIRPPSFDTFVSAKHIQAPIIKIIPTTNSAKNIDVTTQVQTFLINSVYPPIVPASIFVSLAIIVGIIYALLRIKQIRALEADYFRQQSMTLEARHTFGTDKTGSAAADSIGQVRWDEVIRHIQDDNPMGWRQAIIEADSMLDDVITRKGYTGEGIGEKMKQVARGEIHSIDEAWEAHKIRNRIAHDGSDFELSHREAKRTIQQYGSVFKELGYISD